MAPADVVDTVVQTASDTLHYMLPIIAVLSAVMFITSFLIYLVTRMAERTFK